MGLEPAAIGLQTLYDGAARRARPCHRVHPRSYDARLSRRARPSHSQCGLVRTGPYPLSVGKATASARQLATVPGGRSSARATFVLKRLSNLIPNVPWVSTIENQQSGFCRASTRLGQGYVECSPETQRKALSMQGIDEELRAPKSRMRRYKPLPSEYMPTCFRPYLKLVTRVQGHRNAICQALAGN